MRESLGAYFLLCCLSASPGDGRQKPCPHLPWFSPSVLSCAQLHGMGLGLDAWCAAGWGRLGSYPPPLPMGASSSSRALTGVPGAEEGPGEPVQAVGLGNTGLEECIALILRPAPAPIALPSLCLLPSQEDEQLGGTGDSWGLFPSPFFMMPRPCEVLSQ